MSIFSSLNYLLTKGVAGINQTDPSSDELLRDKKSSSNLSLEFGDETSTINTTGDIRREHLLLGAFTSFLEEQINRTLITTSENWTNFTSSTSTPLSEIENRYSQENDVHFPHETYPNAEHLLESWWNIFDSRYMRHGWGLTVTLILAYMLILVVGVIGNVMVILVVLLRPQMRSVTNMFILNLAIADFFVIVFSVPSTLLANIFAPWILGTFMCKSVAYVQGVSVCAAAYSLAAISFDRCQAVYRNYERPRGFSRKTCAKTVFLIWLAAISLTIPWALIFEVKVSEYDGLRYCVETWKNENHGNMYFFVVNFLCFYAIPFSLIFASNWIIYCHVAKRKVPQDSASSAPIIKMHQNTRQHVLKMLGIVTLTFLISWLPVYILMIFVKFSHSISDSEYKALGILMPIAQWLGTLNSGINPILYAFLNKKFRKMFKSILPAWIPVNSTKKHRLSTKTPTFTTSQIEKSLRRGNTYSKTYTTKHVPIKSKSESNLPLNKPDENTAKLVPDKVHVVVCTIKATPVVSICKPVNVYSTGIDKRATIDTIAHL